MRIFAASVAAIVAAIVALSGSALAQGTIDFHNPNTFPLRFSDGTIVGAPGSPLGPASVRVGLFIGQNGATFAQMTMVGMTTNSASTLPLFVGTFNGGVPYAISGRQPGDVVSFAFAAWSISTGALTYPDALASTTGYVTQPAIGQGYTLAGGVNPPAPTFGNPTAAQPWLLNGITFAVPEPSTMVLGIAGAIGLWLLPRRR